MKSSRILIFFAALNVNAAVLVSNISVTATQALIPYTAPSSSACQVQVSESPSYAPLVHDVDPSLFPGAGSDSRPGNITRAGERVFVVGKRAAEVAVDSIRYSRALQTATVHYYKIACDGQTAAGTFTTSTIPFGNTYAEAEAADPLRPGQYAYPTLSPSDGSQTVVDPQTGVLLSRLTMASDQTIFGPGTAPFQVGRSTAWSGVSRLISGTGTATISGSTGKLFLGLDMSQGQFAEFFKSWAAPYSSLTGAFAYYQAMISAAVNLGGTLPAAITDRQIQTCLTVDGANCYSGSTIFTTTLGTRYPATPLRLGTTNTIDLWQSAPGTKIPDFRDQGARLSTTTCDGSTVVTNGGGEIYNVNWGPGSNININNRDYTIAAVNHTAKLTLTSPCHSQQILSIPVTNFGDGYDPASPPTVTVSGDGSGATATTSLVAKGIVGVSLTSGGSGYAANGYCDPLISVSDPTGAGAVVTPHKSGPSGDSIVSISIDNPGQNYTAPILTVFGCGGTGASAAVTRISSHNITPIVVTNGGGEYTTVTVSVDPPPSGIRATATATITSGGFSSYANNFGILVWKATASPDTISLNSASVNYSTNMYFGTGTGGGVEYASPTTIAGPNGHPGYNYRHGNQQSGLTWWLDDLTGQGYLRGTVAGSAGCAGTPFTGQYLPGDPDTHVCTGPSGLSLVKYYLPIGRTTPVGIYEAPSPCDTSGANAPPYTDQQPCYVTKDLAPGTTLSALVQAFTANPTYAPAFDPVRYPTIVAAGSDNLGNLIMTAQSGAYESLGWTLVFNASATSNADGGTSSGPVGNHGCVGGGNPGCIVAALPVWSRKGCRWCNIKGVAVPSDGWITGYVGGWANTGVGQGPYTVPVIDGTANGTINYFDASTSLQPCPVNVFGATGKTCTTVTVGSEPLSPNHGGPETGLPGEIGNLELGDTLTIRQDQNGEQITLIKKIAGAVPGTWIETFARGVNIGGDTDYVDAVSGRGGYGLTGPNPTLTTYCGANQLPKVPRTTSYWFWDFIRDPHGMNADGTTIPPDQSIQTEHLFWSNGNQGTGSQNLLENRCGSGIFGCYTTRLRSKYSSFSEELASTPTAVVAKVLPFSAGSADADFLQSHLTGGGVSPLPGRENFMFDGREYYGGYVTGSAAGFASNPGILMGGQLYKFTAGQSPRLDLPYRKYAPTGAFTGNLPLIDISSPATGDIISTDSTSAYTYCVAAAPNECRMGSSVGDVYVNAPYVRYPFCYIAPQNGNLGDEYDICIGSSLAGRDAITQMGMSQVDNAGSYQRILTKFRRARTVSVFDSPYVFPNGKWLAFEAHLAGDASLNHPFLVAKIPPAEGDSINRSGFESVDVSLPGRAGVTGAYAQFGYVENGAAESFFCTSRAESCVATGSTVNQLSPFYFQKTEAASWSPVSCSAGCKISIPAIPQRTLYYRYVYTSASGQVVYTSPSYITAVP